MTDRECWKESCIHVSWNRKDKMLEWNEESISKIAFRIDLEYSRWINRVVGVGRAGGREGSMGCQSLKKFGLRHPPRVLLPAPRSLSQRSWQPSKIVEETRNRFDAVVCAWKIGDWSFRNARERNFKAGDGFTERGNKLLKPSSYCLANYNT